MTTTIERVCEAIITEWYLESTDFREIFEKHIKDFEALVREDEREACAKVCDEQAERSLNAAVKAKRTTDHRIYHAAAQTATWDAATIRARGNA